MNIKPLKALIFETTSICNLSCKICYINEIKRKPAIMSFDLYKKVLDNTPRLERISLNNWGEPLLNKDLFRMVKYAKNSGIRNVIFTTNGSLLNDKYSNEIIESGLDIIEFSIHKDKESYKNIRNFNYHNMVTIIDNFISFRNKNKSNLKIAIKIVVDNTTELKIKYLKEKWSDKVDYIKLIPRIFSGQKKRNSFCQELIGSYNGRLVILSDGYVVPCCVDYLGLLYIGNANKSSNLSTLWNNHLMTKLRNEQTSGVFRKPCDDCVEYVSKNAEKRFG